MAIRKFNGLFVLAMWVAGPMSARADADMMGSTLEWRYYAGGGALPPSIVGLPIEGGVTGGSFVDNGGIGGEFIEPTDDGPLPVFDIEADGTTITFDYSVSTPSLWSSSPFSLTPTIYNGIAIDLLSAGSFVGVSVDPVTNMAGFGASNVSFTSDQIEVDWQGLAFATSTAVTLDVNYSTSGSVTAPEPGMCGLVFVSLSLVGAAWQRRRNR